MTLPRRASLAAALMAAVLAGAAWATEEVQLPQATGPTVAQAAPAPAPAQASKPSVSTKEPIRPTQVRTAPPPRAEAKPTWAELTVQQQASLAPLATTWGTLGEAHKRKWLALSENFHSMPQPEQARLHSRMTEWAVLSPQQRTTARLNFVEAQKVAPVDKRAKWEAYQALPPEEKKRLAAGAAAAKPPPPPTALAVRPVPKEKLARIPARGKKSEPAAKLAVVPPTPAEGNGLLPAPAASSQP